MQTVSVELSPQQAEQLLEQLPPAMQVRLVHRWEQATRRARWEPLVLKMRRRFARRPFSWRTLRRVCEEVRQEQFEREVRAHRR